MGDTIFARASAAGQAGVAVYRLSGPSAWDVAAQLVGRLPAPRRAALRILRDPASGEVIDSGLVLVFEADASFTGEKTIEFQIHGSVAVDSALHRVVTGLPGVRHAEAGEFTRRAMENGRMDLLQVEGLASLLTAETALQRRQAQDLQDGVLSRVVATWRGDLVEAQALLASQIDFADEDDLPDDVREPVRERVDRVLAAVEDQLAGLRSAERIRDGFEVVITGPPNVGKSTLLNRIAGRDVALVSDIAGTTRDVLEVRLDLDGIPVTLIDTAGLRDSADQVEVMGVARAVDRAERADLVVRLGDGPVVDRQDEIAVLAKADLRTGGEPGLRVSGETGEGVRQLLDEITARLRNKIAGASMANQERHRAALDDAATRLRNARDHVMNAAGFEDLAAEDLRAASLALDGLVGAIGVEDILDVVFSTFCIGK